MLSKQKLTAFIFLGIIALDDITQVDAVTLNRLDSEHVMKAKDYYEQLVVKREYKSEKLEGFDTWLSSDGESTEKENKNDKSDS